MDVADPAGEWLRLAERYRQMTDEELLLLERSRSELTDGAQQVLEGEMQHRGLNFETETPTPPPFPKHLTQPASSLPTDDRDEEDPYSDDRKLFEIRSVWSLRDALQLQWLLDRAGIPFFMGAEKATGVEQVTSDFTKGVSVSVMAVGSYWAGQALMEYAPLDEPPAEPGGEWKEIPVRCPKCRSTEVVFENLTGNPANSKSRFQWTCDQCGNRWDDDGVVND